ncbi:MAG: hypothetical protein AB7J46_06695 [Candidatus Altimarinota bacterium]
MQKKNHPEVEIIVDNVPPYVSYFHDLAVSGVSLNQSGQTVALVVLPIDYQISKTLVGATEIFLEYK